jgi:hypothetical protein
VTDPNGPFFHQVVIGASTNGRAVTGAAQVLDHASVPDGVVTAGGSIAIYYVNGQDGAIWVGRYDGFSLIPVSPIYLNGIRAPEGAADPDVQLLPSGDIRMVYLGGSGEPSDANPYGICIADSDDGTHFTVRSVAMMAPGAATQLTDPSMVRLADGRWLMALSEGNRTAIARSADGYTFARDTSFAIGGVPELAIVSETGLRVYTCGNGIVSFQSSNNGRTWQNEGSVVQSPFNSKPLVCDPSLVPGADLFVFKTGG